VTGWWFNKMGNDYSLIKIDIGTIKDGKIPFYVNTLVRIIEDKQGKRNGATYHQEGPFYVDIVPTVERLKY
jgi:hypothetical protein